MVYTFLGFAIASCGWLSGNFIRQERESKLCNESGVAVQSTTVIIIITNIAKTVCYQYLQSHIGRGPINQPITTIINYLPENKRGKIITGDNDSLS